MKALAAGGLSLFLFLLFAAALMPSGCAMVAPTIPLEECDATCGTAKAEELSKSIAILACDELVSAELHAEITLERCQLAAILANSCRTLCR